LYNSFSSFFFKSLTPQTLPPSKNHPDTAPRDLKRTRSNHLEVAGETFQVFLPLCLSPYKKIWDGNMEPEFIQGLVDPLVAYHVLRRSLPGSLRKIVPPCGTNSENFGIDDGILVSEKIN
jgi:hypothetical protein